MGPIVHLLILALDIYVWLVIFTVVVSWLVVFDVLNTRNRWVYRFCELLNRLTNPPIRQLRKIVPPIGGIDLTPMVLIFGIYVLRGFLAGLLG